MRANKNDIKTALQYNIQRIEDDSFTNTIVSKHLADKKIKSSAFINFLPMIIGLSTVILSIGFVLLIEQNDDWINEIGITENHGIIFMSLSIIFLIYKLMEEITAPNILYK